MSKHRFILSLLVDVDMDLAPGKHASDCHEDVNEAIHLVIKNGLANGGRDYIHQETGIVIDRIGASSPNVNDLRDFRTRENQAMSRQAQARDKLFNMRLNQREWDCFQRCAQHRELSVSEWIRRLVQQEEKAIALESPPPKKATRP